MKPWALALRLAVLGVLFLAVAACVPGPGATSITPVPTPAGPAHPPTVSPTLPPSMPTPSPVPVLPTPTVSPVPLLPTPTTMPPAPSLTLVIMHSNDARGYTEPCG